MIYTYWKNNIPISSRVMKGFGATIFSLQYALSNTESNVIGTENGKQ